MDGLKIERNERKQIFLVCNFFSSLSTPKIAHVNFPADVLVTLTLCFSVSYEQHKSRVMEAIYICRQRKAAAVLAVQLKEHWARFFFVSRVAFRCKKKDEPKRGALSVFITTQKLKQSLEIFVKMIDYAVYGIQTKFSPSTSTSRADWCIEMSGKKTMLNRTLQQTCHRMYLQGETSEFKFILTCLLSSH